MRRWWLECAVPAFLRTDELGPNVPPLATSAPGLGSPVSHLHRDWAHPATASTGMGSCTRICAGTGRNWAQLPPASAPGLGSPLHRDWALGPCLPHLHRDGSPACQCEVRAVAPCVLHVAGVSVRRAHCALHAAGVIMHLARCMLPASCCISKVARCMLPASSCTLRVACCRRHAACCTPRVACCRRHAAFGTGHGTSYVVSHAAHARPRA